MPKMYYCGLKSSRIVLYVMLCIILFFRVLHSNPNNNKKNLQICIDHAPFAYIFVKRNIATRGVIVGNYLLQSQLSGRYK